MEQDAQTTKSRYGIEGGPDRRAKMTADLMQQTGIDDAMIERLVRTFYGRVRRDPLIGPIFETNVADWDHHIAKLCDFWSSVALMTGRYHGQPMQKHFGLGAGGPHFDRWLDMFEATANELCPPAAAAHFIERARRIADSLEMGIAMQQGRIYTPRHVARKAVPA
jgi:hemoglobin